MATVSIAEGTQPPATPVYILRGHTSTIHVLHFFRENSFLVSGDGDGWTIIWSTVSKRPMAVWRAHQGGILNVREWNRDRIITHGRDHVLRVWQFRDEDVGNLDQRLPTEARSQGSEREPWLLHSLPVNSLNFCAFGICNVPISLDAMTVSEEVKGLSGSLELESTKLHRQNSILVAAPNALDSGGVDIFLLPAEKRLATLKSDKRANTGMVMAVAPFFNESGRFVLVSGYESGHTAVHLSQPILDGSQPWNWSRTYINQPHSQPLLSLSISPFHDFYLTCSADAILAKHPIPSSLGTSIPVKTTNTKHAGQQGLMIRSDGKIFATAGWDTKNRVYSTKTMKELAVLKWHKEGCYTVAFGDVQVRNEEHLDTSQIEEQPQEGHPMDMVKDSIGISSLQNIKNARRAKAKETHWLAAGGKDGKISMWDVY